MKRAAEDAPTGQFGGRLQPTTPRPPVTPAEAAAHRATLAEALEDFTVGRHPLGRHHTPGKARR